MAPNAGTIGAQYGLYAMEDDSAAFGFVSGFNAIVVDGAKQDYLYMARDIGTQVIDVGSALHLMVQAGDANLKIIDFQNDPYGVINFQGIYRNFNDAMHNLISDHNGGMEFISHGTVILDMANTTHVNPWQISVSH